MSKKTLLLSSLTLFSLFTFSLSANAETETMDTDLYNRLKGKIILRVESKGEAYYISPVNKKMFFLSRPETAFQVMKEQGVGIKNSDLEKIAVADNYCPSYNLNCDSASLYNSTFANSQKGKIFLQVEENGEAWYVNSSDSKRYFLGRPSDAFAVMKKLGLGVSNVDFEKLTSKNSVIFDGCNSLENYKSNVWYNNLILVLKSSKVDQSKISEGCYAKNKNILILLEDGGYCEFGNIYKFDITKNFLSKAAFDDKSISRGCLASPLEFGSRSGDNINLVGKVGDAGCSSEIHYNYNYLTNMIELKKEYSVCEGENGHWTNY